VKTANNQKFLNNFMLVHKECLLVFNLQHPTTFKIEVTFHSR